MKKIKALLLLTLCLSFVTSITTPALDDSLIDTHAHYEADLSKK